MSELYVDGKKVVGNTELKNISGNLASGFSFASLGSISYTVTNNICTLFIDRILPASSGNNKVMITGVPKAHISATAIFTDGGGASIQGLIYITPDSGNGTTVYANIPTSSVLTTSRSTTLTYPVSPSWHE